MSSSLDSPSLRDPVTKPVPGHGPRLFRTLGRGLRLPLRVWKAALRRPRRAVLFACALLLGLGVGLWGYAVHQWRAAQVALKTERPGEARERLALCLWIWPRSVEVHLLAARAARMTGNFSAAEGHLNRCLQLQDGATEGVQLEFLLIRVQAGEMDELAPALFDLVEQGHPESPEVLDTLARAYMHRLRYKPAYACLTRWIGFEPHNSKPYYWRGWVLERLNNPKAAKEDYDRALEISPDLVPARLRLVEMLLEDKQVPDALPHLERLYQQVPNDPRVQARLGMCRFLQGNAKEARRLMETALADLPNDAPLLISLASLDIQEERGVDAERRLRLVLAADPADTEALFILASALQLQNRTNESAAVLAEYERKQAVVSRINALLKDVADSPTATADNYAELGTMFLQIGRENVAMYWLERAFERDPANQRGHSALAAHHEAKGDRTKAEGHRRQIRVQPEAVPAGATGGRPGP